MSPVPPDVTLLARNIATLEHEPALKFPIAAALAKTLERNGVRSSKVTLREMRVVLAAFGANDRTIDQHARSLAGLVRSNSLTYGSWSSR